MSVRVIFRCEFCDAVPDPMTQLALEGGVRDLDFGAYVDALPGRWLVWHGQGILGPRRYACELHRGDLVAFLRQHYGTVAPHPWKRPPYPTTVHTDGSGRAMRLKSASGSPGFF